MIDKFVLATMKAISVDEATKWVEEHKEILVNMRAMSAKAFDETTKYQGVEITQLLWDSAPNMYELSKQKIYSVGSDITAKGVIYSDFETALPYYKEKGILTGDESEIKEFNDIMDFLYLGRKEKLKGLSTEKSPFVVLNFLS